MEYAHSDLLLETIRNQLGKLGQLFLLVLRVLGLLYKSDYFFLDLAGEVKVVHGCIHSVSLLLEKDCLFVYVVHEDCQLTEQVGLGYGAHDVYY